MKSQKLLLLLTLLFTIFSAAYGQDLSKYPDNVRLKTIISDAKKNHDTSPVTTGELSDFAQQAQKAKKYQLAVDCYEQILKIDPARIEYASIRGLINMNDLKDYKSAIKDFSIPIAAGSKEFTDYYNRGTSYFQLQKYKEALADLNRSFELNSGQAKTLLNRGLTKYYLKDADGAISDLTAGINIDPTIKNLYLARAFAYQMKGDEAKANADNATAARIQ